LIHSVARNPSLAKQLFGILFWALLSPKLLHCLPQ
jgi:F0F1-type ATP synthase membrane subunit c/vacuolar-type H+-ATPase subunit K